MTKPFPSRKDASKQMIQLPSKIHEFKAVSQDSWHVAGGWEVTAAAVPLRWAGTGTAPIQPWHVHRARAA